MGRPLLRYALIRRLKPAATYTFHLLTSYLLLLASGLIYLATTPAFAQEPASPLEQGIQLLDENKLDGALKAFQDAIKQDPKNPLPYYYTGVAYHLKGQPQAALAPLGRALNLAPGMTQAILMIGMVFEDLGRFDKAREAYQAVAGSKEDSPLVKEAQERLQKLTITEHYKKAGRLFKEKKYEEAIKELQTVLSAEPDYADAHFAAGLSYQRLGKLDEAIEAFKRVVAISPTHTEAYRQIAITYEAQSAYDEAMDAFRKIISLKPGSSEAQDSGEKIRDIEKRLETRKLFGRSADLIRREQWQEALTEMRAIIAAEPKNPNALFNLGLILHQLKEEDPAIEALKQAIEVDPKFQKGYYQLGVIYDDLSQYEEAVKMYEQALALGEKTPEAEKTLERLDILRPLLGSGEMVREAKELLEKKDLPGAIREIESLIMARPKDPKLYLTLGTLYLKTGRAKDAASALEKAISFSPDEISLRMLLGQIYEGLKEYQKALEVYQAASRLEKDPRLAKEAQAKAKATALRFHFELGKKYLGTGDYEAALSEMQAILELAPENPLALYNMGVIYDRLDSPAKAESPLRQAIAIVPDYVTAYLQLGLVLEKLRRFAGAREVYEKVISLQAEGREAQLAKSRIGPLKEIEVLSGYLDRAFKLMEKKEWEAARKEIEAAIAASPKNYVGYYYMGLILDRQGIFDEARAAFKKAIEVNPKYAQTYLRLGDLYVKEGEYEEARKIFQEVVAMGPGIPEAEVAATNLKRLKFWQGVFSMSHGFNSNIAFRAKAQWSMQSTYNLGISYILLRGKDWNLSTSLSGTQNVYYKTQFQGNGYTLSLSGLHQFPGDRSVSGSLFQTRSYFEQQPTYLETSFSGEARTEPRNIPTSASLKYNFSTGKSNTNRLSNAENHSLSASISQKFSVRDTVSGSYSFKIHKNLDPIGSNYAGRTHSLSANYSRSLFSILSGGAGYSISFVNYSNPDSTTFFQQFRRNVNQSLTASLSLSLIEDISLSLNYNFAYAFNRTNIPPPSAEESRRLKEILASPIPTVGGGGGYYGNSVTFSIKTTF